jgi:hypothetical protein
MVGAWLAHPPIALNHHVTMSPCHAFRRDTITSVATKNDITLLLKRIDSGEGNALDEFMGVVRTSGGP